MSHPFLSGETKTWTAVRRDVEAMSTDQQHIVLCTSTSRLHTIVAEVSGIDEESPIYQEFQERLWNDFVSWIVYIFRFDIDHV